VSYPIKYCPFCSIKISNPMRRRGYCGCVAKDYENTDGVQIYPRGFNGINYADRYRQKLKAVTIKESKMKNRISDLNYGN